MHDTVMKQKSRTTKRAYNGHDQQFHGMEASRQWEEKICENKNDIPGVGQTSATITTSSVIEFSLQNDQS
jgi:hypothetical protein